MFKNANRKLLVLSIAITLFIVTIGSPKSIKTPKQEKATLSYSQIGAINLISYGVGDPLFVEISKETPKGAKAQFFSADDSENLVNLDYFVKLGKFATGLKGTVSEEKNAEGAIVKIIRNLKLYNKNSNDSEFLLINSEGEVFFGKGEYKPTKNLKLLLRAGLDAFKDPLSYFLKCAKLKHLAITKDGKIVIDSVKLASFGLSRVYLAFIPAGIQAKSSKTAYAVTEFALNKDLEQQSARMVAVASSSPKPVSQTSSSAASTGSSITTTTTTKLPVASSSATSSVSSAGNSSSNSSDTRSTLEKKVVLCDGVTQSAYVQVKEAFDYPGKETLTNCKSSNIGGDLTIADWDELTRCSDMEKAYQNNKTIFCNSCADIIRRKATEKFVGSPLKCEGCPVGVSGCKSETEANGYIPLAENTCFEEKIKESAPYYMKNAQGTTVYTTILLHCKSNKTGERNQVEFWDRCAPRCYIDISSASSSPAASSSATPE